MKFLKSFNENKEIDSIKSYIDDVLLELNDFGYSGKIYTFNYSSPEDIFRLDVYIDSGRGYYHNIDLSKIKYILLHIYDYLDNNGYFNQGYFVVDTLDSEDNIYSSNLKLEDFINKLDNYNPCAIRIRFKK